MNTKIHELMTLLCTCPHLAPEFLTRAYATILKAQSDIRGLERIIKMGSEEKKAIKTYDTVVVASFDPLTKVDRDSGNQDSQQFKMVVKRAVFEEPKDVWEEAMVHHVTCAAEDSDGSLFIGGCCWSPGNMQPVTDESSEGWGDLGDTNYAGLLTKIYQIVPTFESKSKAHSQGTISHFALNKFFYLIKFETGGVLLQHRGTNSSVPLNGYYVMSDDLGLTSARMLKMDDRFVYGISDLELRIYDLAPLKSGSFVGGEIDFKKAEDWKGVPDANETYKYRDHCMNSTTVFLQFAKGIRSFDKRRQQFTNRLYLHDEAVHEPLQTCACNASHVYSGNRKKLFLLSTKLRLLGSIDVYANSEEVSGTTVCQYMHVFKFKQVTMAVGVHSNHHYFVATNFGARLRLLHTGHLNPVVENGCGRVFGVMYSRLYQGLLFYGESKILKLVNISIK